MMQAHDVIWPQAGQKLSDTVHVPIAWDVEEPPGSWWLTVAVMRGSRGALTPEAAAAEVARLIRRHASYNFCMALSKELGERHDTT